MVFRVCRRMLNDPNDVDDAFQATFLILVKNASPIRDKSALGVWLYGVAPRVAVRARVNARRRHLCEKSSTEGSSVAKTTGDQPDTTELRTLLDNGQTGDRYTVFAAVFPKNDLELELKDAAARMGDLRLSADDLANGRDSCRKSATCSMIFPCWRP
jgi:hypothetical protein